MIEMTETPNVIEQKAAAPCFQAKRLVSVPNRPTAHVVSVSGGKDSAVTLALAVARCPADEYKGQPCQCACCWHTDGVCVDHSSGGGCAVCEGPVTDCDLMDYEDTADEDAYEG